VNFRKLLIPALAVCAALTLAPRFFSRAASARSVDGEPFGEIDAFLEREMGRLNVTGAALVIVEGDEIVHLRGFGEARPGGEAPTPQTPFVIGSLTKSFTALAIMQLVEAGQVELDTPVQHYLPWFRVADPQASAQITVRHLLNQTSSLPQLPGMIGLTNFSSRPDEVERQVRDLSTLEISRPPGAKFEYCNVNFNILGLVIEAVSGETYAGYIQQHDAGLVVLDNLGVISGDADENAADMAQVMAALRWVAEETGAALVVIHHQRKGAVGGKQRNGDSLRGHSCIEASLDLALRVERNADDSELLSVEATKARGVAVDPFGARFSYKRKPGTRDLETATFWGETPSNLSPDAQARNAISDGARGAQPENPCR